MSIFGTESKTEITLDAGDSMLKKGITFGAFDLFHAGHTLMLQEAKTVCDHLTVCVQLNPNQDRAEKNIPVQSVIERQIQVKACTYVDDVLVYESEEDVVNILLALDWDVRIIGEEYRHEPFTGRDITLDRCYFNRRSHDFSTSELRKRVT